MSSMLLPETRSPHLPHPGKIALLEWSDATHDVITVSIHTYERAPQLVRIHFQRVRTPSERTKRWPSTPPSSARSYASTHCPVARRCRSQKTHSQSCRSTKVRPNLISWKWRPVRRETSPTPRVSCLTWQTMSTNGFGTSLTSRSCLDSIIPLSQYFASFNRRGLGKICFY